MTQTDAHKLPNGVSFEDGAALGTPAMAGYRALFIRGEVKSGDRVLVHGATGGVGVICVQLVRLKKFCVVCSVCDMPCPKRGRYIGQEPRLPRRGDR